MRALRLLTLALAVVFAFTVSASPVEAADPPNKPATQPPAAKKPAMPFDVNKDGKISPPRTDS